MANSQTRLIIILAAVLLAVIAVSAIVLVVLPSEGDTELGTEAPGVTVDETPGAATSGAVPAGGTHFDTRVLQSSGFISLDKQPIQEGALPVQPPAGVGKANPFL